MLNTFVYRMAYVRAHHGWTCTASPVRNAAGEILGVLDVSHPLRYSSAETASLVRCGTRLAEALLAGSTRTADEEHCAPVNIHPSPVTSIRLLGWKPAVVRADGSAVALTPRRAELLALLASREAWSARSLAEELYSDRGATATVRGEVRRLRQLTGLAIDSQPYALAPHERSCVDYLSVEHPDDLLPESEIPAIADLRYGIWLSVRDSSVTPAPPPQSRPPAASLDSHSASRLRRAPPTTGPCSIRMRWHNRQV